MQLVQTVWVRVWSPVKPTRSSCCGLHLAPTGTAPAAATGRKDQRAPLHCADRRVLPPSLQSNFTLTSSPTSISSTTCLLTFSCTLSTKLPSLFHCTSRSLFCPSFFPFFPSPSYSHLPARCLTPGNSHSLAAAHTQNDTVSSSSNLLSPDYDLPSAPPLLYPRIPVSAFLYLFGFGSFSTDTTATPIEPLLRRRRRPLCPLRHHLQSVCDFRQDIVKRCGSFVQSFLFSSRSPARHPYFSDSIPVNPCL